MESSERVVSDGADDEEQHSLRLRALLHELVRKKGRVQAARELGLDPRTVGACMDGEGMSWRVREALERALQGGVGSAAEREQRLNQDLERRVEELEGWRAALEKELGGGLEAVAGEVEGLREECTRNSGQVERQLGRVEAHRGVNGEQEDWNEAEGLAVSSGEQRRYPEVVTKDPAPDDEEVFGVAWPLIDEWRRLREGHPNEGKSLSWLTTEERIRELEVAMLEDQGLTLPPETEPLQGLDRNSQLNWRTKALHGIRMRRARRELLWSLLRVLTLGLWRM
ncbi:MAG: hypothetical protein OXI83_08055 [Gemmatimonadota bacterium]|nr:hypothetical protein [Gemmatimonadota bacterium]